VASSAELVLHPVRLRIVQAFLGESALATTQLRERLPDVPVATLYRQVATLVEGGLLEVVDERQVRGATERRYALRVEAASMGPEEAAAVPPEEHRRLFMTFVAGLLADFDRYLARDDVDLGRDLVGYRQAVFNLSDDELLDLMRDLGGVLAPRLALPPAPGRRRRVFSTVLVPTD
jgi:DNA-binding transcriptional ArsR family regulator